MQLNLHKITMVQQYITPTCQALDLLHTIHVHNNHSNELSIVKYSLYHFNKKNYDAHTIKTLVICNLLMVNYYKINTYTYNLHTLISAIIPTT